MSRAVSIAVALLVLGGVAAPAAVAEPNEPTQTSVVRFTSHFVDPGTRPSGLGSCTATNPMLCDFRYEGTARFTGALTSDVEYFGYLHYDAVKHTTDGEGWDHHTGFLKGCGQGSFVLHQTDERGDPTSIDPTTGTFRLTLKWEILPGSGTGAFRGARGSGTAWGIFHPDLSNEGEYTGAMTCPAHKD